VTEAPALELEGVSKNYQGLRPLRILRLSVAAAESVAILGLDRASAEVFVNLVTGATLPDTGTVRTFGLETSSIVDGDAWLASLDRIGMVTERAVLLEQLTAIQNLAIPMTLDVEPPSEPVRRRAEALASEVGLPTAVWTHAVANLNGAARGRVRLGRALATDPALLLVEHVSAALPAGEAAALGRDIRAIAATRRIAIVAATADQAFARAVAARVLTHEPASGRLLERRGWLRRSG